MTKVFASTLAILVWWASSASAAAGGTAAQSPQSLPESVSAPAPSVPASPPTLAAPTLIRLGGQSVLRAFGGGTNTFAGEQTGGTISAGILALPATASQTVGVLTLGGQSFLHASGGVTNTFVGWAAGGGFATTGGSNAAFGAFSLAANTSGNSNAAFGAFSLFLNTTGHSNAAFGYASLLANTTGWNNAAFGANTLSANTTGGGNAAFGRDSLNANTTGWSNAAFGAQSLLANTAGPHNAAFGTNSLRENTTGDSNAAFGSNSMLNNTTGFTNAAFGYFAGDKNTTGNWNTYIGAYAGPDAAHDNLENSAAIGAWARVTQSDSIVLGGTNATGYPVSVGIGTSAPNTTLQVVGDIRVGTSGANGCVRNFAGTGIAGSCSSDLRLKTNVRPFESVLDRIVRLQPVRFNWKTDQFPEYHFGAGLNSGLIAQDVEQVFPEMVTTDERGFKMVNYSELPYLTLAAVRELDARANDLQAQNDALRTQLAALADRLARLERRQ